MNAGSSPAGGIRSSPALGSSHGSPSCSMASSIIARVKSAWYWNCVRTVHSELRLTAITQANVNPTSARLPLLDPLEAASSACAAFDQVDDAKDEKEGGDVDVSAARRVVEVQLRSGDPDHRIHRCDAEKAADREPRRLPSEPLRRTATAHRSAKTASPMTPLVGSLSRPTIASTENRCRAARTESPRRVG